jgi:hypothetical protein
MLLTIRELGEALRELAERAFSQDPRTAYLATLLAVVIVALFGMWLRFLWKIERDRNRLNREVLRTIRELNPRARQNIRIVERWRKLFEGDR